MTEKADYNPDQHLFDQYLFLYYPTSDVTPARELHQVCYIHIADTLGALKLKLFL